MNLRATTLRLKASMNAQSSERVVQFSAFGRGTSGDTLSQVTRALPLSAKKGG